MAQIGSLSVKLGLITVEWDQATAKAKQQAKDLQKSFGDLGENIKTLSGYWKTLGGAIGVGSLGFGALLQQTISFTAEIKDLSNSFGLTIGQTLAFRSALMGAGASADSATKMISTLFGKVDEAQKGNDTVIAQFEKLGISFSDLQKLSPYDAIQKVAAGFSNINNQFEKTKMIKEFFGKAGIGVSIDEISASLAKGTGEFDKHAASLKKLGEVEDSLKRSMENMKIAFADLIAPFANEGNISVEKFSAAIKAMVAAFAVGQVINFATAIWEIKKAVDAAKLATVAFDIVTTKSIIGLAAKAAAILAGFAAYKYSMSESENQIAPESGGEQETAQAAQDRIHAARAARDKEVEAKRTSVDLTNQLIRFDSQRAAIQQEMISGGQTYGKLMLEDVNLAEKKAQINSKRDADLLAAKDGTAALKGQINALADAEIRRVTNSSAANKKLVKDTDQYRQMLENIAANPSFRRFEAANYGESSAAGVGNSQASIDARFTHGQAADEQTRLATLANKRLQYENSLYLLMPQEQEYLLAQYDLEAKITEFKRQQDQLGGIPQQKEEETQQEYETRVADFERMKELRVEDIRIAGQQTIKLNQQTKDQQKTFQYGWEAAYSSYMDNSTNAAKIAGDSFNSITSNMSNAIDNFVKTGKLSFSDLARSIIQDLIAIQLKASANTILGGLMGSLFGGGMGSDLSGYNGTRNNFSAFVAQRASGGPLGQDQLSLVGENGPELFIPKTAGTIIPNNKMSSMGNTTNVTNYNIQAIDTKSFEDRILGSSKAVWAANAYGEKSLALGRGRT